MAHSSLKSRCDCKGSSCNFQIRSKDPVIIRRTNPNLSGNKVRCKPMGINDEMPNGTHADSRGWSLESLEDKPAGMNSYKVHPYDEESP